MHYTLVNPPKRPTACTHEPILLLQAPITDTAHVTQVDEYGRACGCFGEKRKALVKIKGGLL